MYDANAPTRQAELDRLDLKHHIMMLLCDNHLHLAPLVKPEKVLDIGTGTGIWAIQMGDQYPESTVIGTDLSPVQPSWYVYPSLVEEQSERFRADYFIVFLQMSASRLTM